MQVGILEHEHSELLVEKHEQESHGIVQQNIQLNTLLHQ